MTRCALIVTALLALCVALPVRAQQDMRETPPTPSTPEDFALPQQRTFELPNGLGVTMVPYGTVPKVTLRLVLPGGSGGRVAGDERARGADAGPDARGHHHPKCPADRGGIKPSRPAQRRGCG